MMRFAKVAFGCWINAMAFDHKDKQLQSLASPQAVKRIIYLNDSLSAIARTSATLSTLAVLHGPRSTERV
jgi:hypothetical protein